MEPDEQQVQIGILTGGSYRIVTSRSSSSFEGPPSIGRRRAFPDQAAGLRRTSPARSARRKRARRAPMQFSRADRPSVPGRLRRARSTASSRTDSQSFHAIDRSDDCRAGLRPGASRTIVSAVPLEKLGLTVATYCATDGTGMRLLGDPTTRAIKSSIVTPRAPARPGGPGRA